MKDKDGSDIVEETITNADGSKQVVRRKAMKDKDGSDIVEETIVNSDGSKQVVRKKVT